MTGNKFKEINKEINIERDKRELKKKIDKILRKELDELGVDYNTIYIVKGGLVVKDVNTEALKEALLT